MSRIPLGHRKAPLPPAMYSWNRCHVKKSNGATMPSDAPIRTTDLNFGRRTMRSNYNSTKVCFAYFGLLLGETLRKKKPWLLFLMAHPTGTKSKVQSVSHFL